MPEKARADGEDVLYITISSTLPVLLENARKFQLRSMAYCHELNWLYEKIRCGIIGAAVMGEEKHRSMGRVHSLLSGVTVDAMAYKTAAREEGYAMFTALCKARLQCAALSAIYEHLPSQQSNDAIAGKISAALEFSQAIDALLPKQLLVIARLSHLLGLCEQMLHPTTPTYEHLPTRRDVRAPQAAVYEFADFV